MKLSTTVIQSQCCPCNAELFSIDTTFMNLIEEEEEEETTTPMVPTVEDEMFASATPTTRILRDATETNEALETTFPTTETTPSTDENDTTTVTESATETSTMLARGQRQLNLDEKEESEKKEEEEEDEKGGEEQDDESEEEGQKPSALIAEVFGRYFNRLRRIYELDIKLLEQLSSLLTTVNQEVIPNVQESIEPLLISSQVENLNLVELIGNIVGVLQRSDVELAISTKLGTLDFLDIGKNNTYLFLAANLNQHALSLGNSSVYTVDLNVRMYNLLGQCLQTLCLAAIETNLPLRHA